MRPFPLTVTAAIDAGIRAVCPCVSSVTTPPGAMSDADPSVTVTIVNESRFDRSIVYVPST